MSARHRCRLAVDRLAERGLKPAILSRGHGGSASGPLWVDPAIHDAGICGDEPLMLADGRDVMIARDRARGARMIAERGGHDLVIMDDGMQNPYLAHDLEIGVFDGGFGIGNGWLMPAGPLRAPAAPALAQLDLAMINGVDETGLGAFRPGSLPVSPPSLRPGCQRDRGTGRRAAAGLCRDRPPVTFLQASLEAAGGTIVRRCPLPTITPIRSMTLQIQEDAQRHGAEMITTKKDWMRLPPDWRSRVAMLPVSMEIDQATLARVDLDRTGHHQRGRHG